jgi:hypothetical protein
MVVIGSLLVIKILVGDCFLEGVEENEVALKGKQF